MFITDGACSGTDLIPRLYWPNVIDIDIYFNDKELYSTTGVLLLQLGGVSNPPPL